jgi:hypothetical protein
MFWIAGKGGGVVVSALIGRVEVPIMMLNPPGWRLIGVPEMVRPGAPGRRVCDPTM